MKVIVVLEEHPPATLSFSQKKDEEETYCFVSLCRFQDIYDLSDFFKPDLFLLDEEIEGISGTALAYWLHSKKGLADVPIVVRSFNEKKQKHLRPPLYSLSKSAHEQTLFDLIKRILKEPGPGNDPLLPPVFPFAGYRHSQAVELIQQRSHLHNGRNLTALDWKAIPSSGHFVQFYKQDKSLIDQLSAFIAEGLLRGEGCIVVATKAHQQKLETQLQARGFDLTLASSQDAYIYVNAVEALSQLFIDGEITPLRFAEVVGSLMRRAARGGRSMRIFGEMVMLLWREGKYQEALRLEGLWNDLQQNVPPFSLFCAYPSSFFAEAAHQHLFNEICKLHSHITSDETSLA